MKKEYEIGGQHFYQDELVFAQIEHVSRRLEAIPSLGLTIPSLITMLAQRIDIIACIVIPDKLTQDAFVDVLDSNQLVDHTTFLRKSLKIGLATEIVADFFDCNPVSLILSAITGLLDRVKTTVMTSVTPPKTASKDSMRRSPGGDSLIVPSSGGRSPSGAPVPG